MNRLKRLPCGHGMLMLTILLLVLSSPVCFGQQVLRWKFQPGDQFKVTTEQKTESNTQAADQSLKMTIQLTVEEQWDIKQVDEKGVAEIARSLTRIQLLIRSPVDEEISFDSAKKRSAPGVARSIAEALGPVLDKPMRIQLNPRGAVVGVELGEQLKTQLAELAKVLGEFFSPDSIEQQLMTIGRLPAGPVKQGASWMTQVTATTPLGTLSVSRTFTYEGEKPSTEGNLSEIVIAGQIILVPPEKENDRKVTLNKQTLEGVLRFDAAAGRLVESHELQTLEIQTAYREIRIESQVKTSTHTTVTPIMP